jgi:hypothetical protein
MGRHVVDDGLLLNSAVDTAVSSGRQGSINGGTTLNAGCHRLQGSKADS